MTFNKPHLIFLGLCVVIALLLRSYKLAQVAYFNADQEAFAFKAVEIIKDKNFTLLGFKAGEVDLYVGPLMYYIYALVYLIGSFNPFAPHIFHLLLTALTLVSIFLISQRLFSRQTAIFACLVYAFSPLFIDWDQRVWLPTPLIFVSSWIYYLILTLDQKNQLHHFFYLGLLLAFGFQLHHVILIFYPLIALWLIIQKFKPSIKPLLLGLITAFSGFLPIIIFDFRHRFLNFYNWIELFSQASTSFNRVQRFKILLQTQGYIVLNIINLPQFSSIAALIILLLLVFTSKLNRLWLAIPLIVFTFPNIRVPEYYFVIVFPIILFSLAKLFTRLYEFNKYLLTLLLIVFCFTSINNTLHPNLINRISLASKTQAIKYVKDNSQGTITVNRLIEPAHNFGFDYLFYYHLGYIPEQGSSPNFSLVVPWDYQQIVLTHKFGGIGIIDHEN